MSWMATKMVKIAMKMEMRTAAALIHHQTDLRMFGGALLAEFGAVCDPPFPSADTGGD
jgi:hypothetical protein